MPNSFFRFKQFTVQQDKAAMKVCTDACIFGAWVSKKIHDCNYPVTNCLDIGTGTGLLSLMIAQMNFDIKFDAVEIEQSAFKQAKENFMNSPWSQRRLNAIHADIKNFSSSKKYDFIITNPPFFKNDLLPGRIDKKLAKHEEGLSLEKLITIIDLHLKRNGCFAILLPYNRINYFEKKVQNKFFVKHKLLIRQTPLHNFFRGILFCETNPAAKIGDVLIIKNNEGEYTDEFKKLLQDYYLNL